MNLLTDLECQSNVYHVIRMMTTRKMTMKRQRRMLLTG